jgi:hypothetical protein
MELTKTTMIEKRQTLNNSPMQTFLNVNLCKYRTADLEGSVSPQLKIYRAITRRRGSLATTQLLILADGGFIQTRDLGTH